MLINLASNGYLERIQSLSNSIPSTFIAAQTSKNSITSSRRAPPSHSSVHGRLHWLPNSIFPREPAREFAPDLVVTDYSMPDMNGLTFAYWLRENFPSCKIVIISGEISVVEQKAKGGSSFTLLQKPFNLKVLLAAIR